MVAARIAFWITRPFISFGYERVRTTKKVIAPMGFTIAKSATKVVMAKLTRSAAMPARPRQRPVLERVEHFSRERQIPGVSQGCERRMGSRLVRDDLPFNDFDASDLHEGPGPEGLDRPVDLFDVRRIGCEMAARPQGIAPDLHRSPRGWNIDNERIDVSLLNAGADISPLELDTALEPRVSDISSGDIERFLQQVVGHHASGRTHGLREGDCQRAGTDAHLDDHVARFHVAIPDDRWSVLRADDLGPSTDGLDLVPDGGRQDEERPVADPPPAPDGPA